MQTGQSREIVKAGRTALKASFILNGGAGIALLAFMADLGFEWGSEKAKGLATCLISFGLGAAMSAFGSTLTYFALISRRTGSRGWERFHSLMSIFMGYSSLLMYLVGLSLLLFLVDPHFYIGFLQEQFFQGEPRDN